MFKRYIAISVVIHVLVIFLLLFVVKPKDTSPKYKKEKPLIARIVPPELKPAPQTNIPPAKAPLEKQQSLAQEAKKSAPSEAKPSVNAIPPGSTHKQSPPKPKVYEQDKPIAKAPQPPLTPKGFEEPRPKDWVTPPSPIAPPAPDKTEGSSVVEPKSPPKPAPPSIGNLFDSDIIQKHAMASRKKNEGTRDAPSDSKDNSLSLDVDDMRYAMYMQRLKEGIESVWEYPQSASRKKTYGDLYISFTINKNGTLGAVEVVRTSGHKVLDEAAVRSIKDAAPFWPLPDEWGKDSFTIRGHFVYNIYTF
ncbi:protein containing TonB [Candidatus Magnetobacterium bavaricum]|uniref:Protein containing TonB n=1 Tax=Candidatus Magnetobacterium bavaricum TaxID=29290 RepID=A0A0F3GXD8_9BACT|nr:protein containing TonB [Candidatus Magnetobacterium bavaricum]